MVAIVSFPTKKSNAAPVEKSSRLNDTKPSYKSPGVPLMIVAASSSENVIVPPAGHSNVRVLKYICLALSRNWIVSCPRVYGAAATRKKPSCTITTASGSRYCQNPPSGSGNPAGIQSPSPVTTDAKFEYSIISLAEGDAGLLMDFTIPGVCVSRL